MEGPWFGSFRGRCVMRVGYFQFAPRFGDVEGNAERVLSALQDAEVDLLCHPSNLVLAHGQQAMVTRCLENAVFPVTTNRIGFDLRPRGTLSFTGASQIAGPGGRVIHRAGAEEEALFVASLGLQEARDKTITPQNDLMADRRHAFYERVVRNP